VLQPSFGAGDVSDGAYVREVAAGPDTSATGLRVVHAVRVTHFAPGARLSCTPESGARCCRIRSTWRWPPLFAMWPDKTKVKICGTTKAHRCSRLGWRRLAFLAFASEALRHAVASKDPGSGGETGWLGSRGEWGLVRCAGAAGHARRGPNPHPIKTYKRIYLAIAGLLLVTLGVSVIVALSTSFGPPSSESRSSSSCYSAAIGARADPRTVGPQ
jgi:hypothetical protein